MKKTLWGFLWLGFTASLPAQPLAWPDAVRAARENNPDLSSARSQVESARAALRAAVSEFLPQVSGSGSYDKSKAGSGGSSQDSYVAALSARQSLFSGFRSKSNLDLSRARLEGSEAALDSAESAVAGDLRSAFIVALYAQENKRLLERIRERVEENRKLIELRYQAGRENKGSFLRAGAQLSQAGFEVEQSGRSLGRALKGLARQMGRDQAPDGPIQGNFEVELESAPPDLAALALRNPLYRQGSSALEQSRAALGVSRSGFFPDLSLSGTGRRQGGSFPPDSDSWSVGASVSLPFFSGGSDFYGVRQAQAAVRQASSDLESRRRQIEFNLEDAHVKFRDAAEQVGVRRQFLEASQERARIARAQYGNGLISYQDWDIIENDLINSEKQMLTSLRDAALAEAAWLQAQGKGFAAYEK